MDWNRFAKAACEVACRSPASNGPAPSDVPPLGQALVAIARHRYRRHNEGEESGGNPKLRHIHPVIS